MFYVGQDRTMGTFCTHRISSRAEAARGLAPGRLVTLMAVLSKCANHWCENPFSHRPFRESIPEDHRRGQSPASGVLHEGCEKGFSHHPRVATQHDEHPARPFSGGGGATRRIRLPPPASPRHRARATPSGERHSAMSHCFQISTSYQRLSGLNWKRRPRSASC